MTRYSLLICLFGITIYFAGSIIADEAMIGGQNAKEHQFPYLGLVMYKSRAPKCGSAIIGDKHILTAAHCLINPITNQFYPSRLFVVTATNNLRKTLGTTIIVEVERIFVPVSYNSFGSTNEGDIAVLELKKPLELSKHKREMRKLRLPKNATETFSGKTATIAGFGWNWVKFDGEAKYGNNTDGRLRFAEADVLDDTECSKLFPKMKFSDKHLCARVKQIENTTRGVCKGDSGGPLVIDDSIVIGILSGSPRKCGEDIGSGVYTRVSHYLTFIADALAGKLNRNIRTHIPTDG